MVGRAASFARNQLVKIIDIQHHHAGRAPKTIGAHQICGNIIHEAVEHAQPSDAVTLLVPGRPITFGRQDNDRDRNSPHGQRALQPKPQPAEKQRRNKCQDQRMNHCFRRSVHTLVDHLCARHTMRPLPRR